MQAHVKYPHLIRISSYLSVATATCILCAKIYGWVLTDSVAIFASLVDSMLDIAASAVNVIAINFALAPPDDDHRFGHDKIQDLAVFAQSVLFGISGLFIIFSAIQKFANPHLIEHADLGMGVMIFSVIATMFLVSFQTYVYNLTKNSVVAADKFHYFVDLMTNIGVIISIYITKNYGGIYLDPILAIFIALYIMRGSWHIFKGAYRNLIDEEFSAEDKTKLLKILSDMNVKGVHELKTRYAGNKYFIQFHLEMDGKLSLYEAHKLSDKVEDAILRIFPGCEIIIHQDPAGLEKNVQYKEL